jgi:Na+/pantothenate symporter
MLGWVDVAVVVLYLVLVLAIGLGARFFPGSSSKGGGKDVAEYFLAGRNVAWWAVGMSLFSSNIGSEHFVGSPPLLNSPFCLFLLCFLRAFKSSSPAAVTRLGRFGSRERPGRGPLRVRL